jgi:type IV secretion system protein VirB10
MSDPRRRAPRDEDFEEDEELPRKPWWKQAKVLLLVGGLVILLVIILNRGVQHPPGDQKAQEGQIRQVVNYAPPKADPAPALAPIRAATAAPLAPQPPLTTGTFARKPPSQEVARPIMLSYATPDHKAGGAADPPKDAAETGLKFATADIPGLKASPAIDDTYQLMPGLLPCVLDTAIAGDLPGPLLCHLPGPVYSPKGVLLMEAGSQVVGRYESMQQNGAQRLMAVSTYAHTPNGVWVPLTGQPLADGLGRNGLDGEIDNRYLERFGGAILLDIGQSGLGIVQAAVSKGGNTYISTNSSDNLASQILQATINLPPLFSKHQGETIAIWLTEPIDFSGSYRIRQAGQ